MKELNKSELDLLDNLGDVDGHSTNEMKLIVKGLRLLREQIQEELDNCDNAIKLFERFG